MTDNIATLGLQIDSSQALQAAKALQTLQAAAAPASAAVSSMTAAARPASAALATLAEASESHSASLRSQRLVLMGLASDLGALSSPLGAATAAAASLYVENSHLFEGFGNTESAIGKLLTPTNLLVGGVIGLGAAAIIAATSVTKSELAIGELSERTQTAVTSLHELQTAAAFKGISSEDFNKSITEFEGHLLDAKNNVGELSELLAANGSHATTLSDTLGKVADIVKGTSSSADQFRIVQEAGLPATREWVQFLSQGAAGIAAAESEARKFSSVADESLIARARAFDDAWNHGWANFAAGAKSAAVSAISAFSSFAGSINTTLHAITGVSGAAVLGAASRGEISGSRLNLTSDTDSLYGHIGNLKPEDSGSGGAPGDKKDPAVIKARIAQEQGLLAILGPMATIEQQVAEVENRITLARLAQVPVTQNQANALVEYTRNQLLGINAIQSQIDSQKIAIATAGMSTAAASAYSVVQEKINEATLRGAPLNAQEIAQLRDRAAALRDNTTAAQSAKLNSDLQFGTQQLGRNDLESQVASQLHSTFGGDITGLMSGATADLIRFNSVMSDLKSTSSGILSGFIQDLQHGKSGMEALQGSVQKVESKLADMAANAIISNLFKNLISSFAPAGGGAPTTSAPAAHGGGLVGSSGVFRTLDPSMWMGASRFHTGGLVDGEVPVIAQKGEHVLTASQWQKLNTPAAPAAPAPAATQVHVYNQATNSTVETNTRRSGGVDIHEIVVKSVGDAMSNGKLDGPMRARYGSIPQPRGR
jgi:hypothetical protein